MLFSRANRRVAGRRRSEIVKFCVAPALLKCPKKIVVGLSLMYYREINALLKCQKRLVVELCLCTVGKLMGFRELLVSDSTMEHMIDLLSG